MKLLGGVVLCVLIKNIKKVGKFCGFVCWCYVMFDFSCVIFV